MRHAHSLLNDLLVRHSCSRDGRSCQPPTGYPGGQSTSYVAPTNSSHAPLPSLTQDYCLSSQPDAEDDANRPEGPTDSPSKVDTPIEKSNTNLPLKHITTAATAISTPVRSVSASLFQTGSSTFVLPTAAPVFRPSILSSLSSHSPSSPAPPPQPAAPATPTAQEIQLRLQARLDQAARDAQAQAEAQAAAAALALKGGSTSSTADRLRERERGEKRKRSSLGGHSSSSSSVSDHHHHRPGSSAAGSSSTMASKSSTSGSTPEERKEKKLRGMLSELVVKTLSKYKDKMDHERFKKSAREVSLLA